MSCIHITLDFTLLAYGLGISISFVAIRYLMALIFDDVNGIYEAKFMLGDMLFAFAAVLTVGFLISVTSSSSNNLFKSMIDTLSTSAGSSNNGYVRSTSSLLCGAESYLAYASAYAMDLYKADMWAAMNFGLYAGYTVNYNAANYLAKDINIGVTYSPVSSWMSALLSLFQGRASVLKMLAIYPLISQYFILSLFNTPVINSLLVLIVVFRTLPFFKGFSNVVLAIIVTFSVIMPFVVYAESYIFHPPTTSQIISKNVADGDFYSDLQKFKLVTTPSKEFNRLQFGPLYTNVLLNPLSFAGYDIVEDYFDSYFGGVDSGRFCIDTGWKAVGCIWYYNLLQLNTKMYIDTAFLSSINLLTAAVSIKALQLMLGDAESLMEVFIQWT